MKRFILVLLSLTSSASTRADVSLPTIFSDHMVLQQEVKIPVWGTAEPAEKISVSVAEQNATTTAGPDGKWRIDLAPFPAGSSARTMTVRGKNTRSFQDVLIGEVWLASGQSNMEASLSYDHNGTKESAQANDPQLRLFRVARRTSLQPLSDLSSPFNWGRKPPYRASDGDQPGRWVACNPRDASEFSAVAYYFGKELRDHLHRPVGLIGSYWGGTPAEAWTSLSGLRQAPPFTSYVEAYEKNLAAFPKLNADYEKALSIYRTNLKDYENTVQETLTQYQAAVKAWDAAAKSAAAVGQAALPNKPADRPALPVRPKAPDLPDGGSLAPANLFNGMIAPLIPYAIKGVLWYQGESNTRSKALEYRVLFPRLMTDWREKWGEGNFPFLYVQISHFPFAGDQSSALVREAQLKALAAPATGMAVTVDIPCDDAGHPHDKEDPAKRLALAARHVAYGESLTCSGPLYQSMKVEGNGIRIRFAEVGAGLMIGKTPYQPANFGKSPVTPYPSDQLVGFTIAGEERKFVPADARIDGDTVIVSSPEVANPKSVRFAWGDKVECNLYNRESLPASPFRTDDWNDFKYSPLAPGVVPPTFGPSVFGHY